MDVFDQLFVKKVDGLSATFMDVFNVLAKFGFPVFIIGGAVRDVVLGKNVRINYTRIDIGSVFCS